jgi:hypothetical protein
MGGFVGDVLGGVGDAFGGVVNEVGNFGQKILDNPIPAVTAYATGNPAALLAYGAPSPQGTLNPQTGRLEYPNVGNTIGGLMREYGGYVGSTAAKNAIQTAQEEARRAGQQGAAMAQFRPIGITTRFGSSQFQVDPITGQLVSAGYTAAPEIAQAQNRLMGLGAGYLAQTPEQVAADYMARQQELLAPSRERQLAQLQNQLYQTGRGGLSVGATGARPSGAAGLGATTPEMEAYYNALAQQDAALAAQAQQAGQQQIEFGTGLFGKAGELEALAQRPLSLSSQLAQLVSGAGAQAGRLGLAGNLGAVELGSRKELAYSPTASILGALTSPTSTLPAGLGNLYGGLFGVAPSWTTGADVIPTSTFGGYGDVSDLAQYGVF